MVTITMNNIIDIHSHILPGVDDGSQSYEESIEIINALNNKGIKDIVLTSHYIENSKYSVNKTKRKEILKKLKSMVGCDVHLYLGNEVFACENVIKLLKEGEIITLNNSRYLLMELPLAGYLNQLPNILCELDEYGIIPIIAHPERYRYIQKHPERVMELLEYNCILQCNIDSLIGKYGKDAKKVMKWLLKHDLVTFVSTDTHSLDGTKTLEKAYKKLKKLVDKDKFIELTYSNSLKVLQNKSLKEEEVVYN